MTKVEKKIYDKDYAQRPYVLEKERLRSKKRAGDVEYKKSHRVSVNSSYRRNLSNEREKRRIYYYLNREEILGKYRERYQINLTSSRSKGRLLSRLRERSIKILREVFYRNSLKGNGDLVCYLCGKPTVNGDAHLKPVLEHKVPLCRGGKSVVENLDVAHAVCNWHKSTMTSDEYLRSCV